MADLDLFKSINDSYGHLAGDAVLREAACRLKAAARRYDSVGRYGGEEFLIVLPGCNAAEAAIQGERIARPSARPPSYTGWQTVMVTASLGVACSSHSVPETLVREADDALYLAKENGRNRVVVHCTELSVPAAAR